MAEPIRLSAVPDDPEVPADPTALLTRIARGDDQALGQLYDVLGAAVFGLARRIVRDPSRAEEITQEVFVQAWQKAGSFDASRGSGRTWIMTLAHRRAVDVVRHDQASTDRENRYDWSAGPDHDVVAETVTLNLEHEQVRRCLGGLTDLQREAINLAYYQGHTYPEVAELLDANLPTIKTRMRDGLIRLRDCMGVNA